MKVCLIQPYYSTDYNDTIKCYNQLINLMDECDDSMDIIIMPEYCDIPAKTLNKEMFHQTIKLLNESVLNETKKLAVRCQATVFINCAYQNKNTTHIINKSGVEIGRYYKAHPAPSEGEKGNAMDTEYSMHFAPPYTIVIDDVKYGFMTCYDFYEYENYANLARQNIDIIIGCSHQRTDKHGYLETVGKFLSYNTNAYLCRSSVSLGEDKDICGCSMIVSPDGEMLLNMKSKIGIACYEIDPKKKYYKEAGFNGKIKAHYEYIEDGRRPWLYRSSGSMIVENDFQMPYPRICYDNRILQEENSFIKMAGLAFYGVQEIALRVSRRSDGIIIPVSKEDVLHKVQTFDFSFTDHSKVMTLETIFMKLSSHVVFNIELSGSIDESLSIYNDIVELTHKYDLEKYIYFSSPNINVLIKIRNLNDKINLCFMSNILLSEIDQIVKYNIQKVYFEKSPSLEIIKKANEFNLIIGSNKKINSKEYIKNFYYMTTNPLMV